MSAVIAQHLESRRLLSVTPTDFDQYQLELINRARANPAAEASRLGIDLNEGLPAGTIEAAPKQPLAFDPVLITSSTTYSLALLGAVNYFNHFYNGTSPQSRMTSAGYVFTPSYAYGENIAVQASTGPFPVNASITDLEYSNLFIDKTEAGRGHRVNMMDGDFKEVGVGILGGGDYLGLGGSTPYNAVLSTEDFAASAADPDPFITGVAFVDNARTGFYAPGDGLGDVKITATRAGTSTVYSTTTWPSGGYSLPVPAGTYAVAASGGGLGATITREKVVVGSLNVEEDFQPPPPIGAVTGIVFDDHNSDGIQQHADAPIAGVTLELREIENGKYVGKTIKATSSKLGAYTFSKIPPGTYRVIEAVPAHDKLTAPKVGSFTVHVTAGKTITKENFGDHIT